MAGDLAALIFLGVFAPVVLIVWLLQIDQVRRVFAAVLTYVGLFVGFVLLLAWIWYMGGAVGVTITVAGVVAGTIWTCFLSAQAIKDREERKAWRKERKELKDRGIL